MLKIKYQKRFFSLEIIKKIVYFKIFNQLLGNNLVFFKLSSFIPFFFKFITIYLYRGINFKKLLINRFNIGYKLGNFITTKKKSSAFKKTIKKR